MTTDATSALRARVEKWLQNLGDRAPSDDVLNLLFEAVIAYDPARVGADTVAALTSDTPPVEREEDGLQVFNCRRCPVSVESRWLAPDCPECGDPTEHDPAAKPVPPEAWSARTREGAEGESCTTAAARAEAPVTDMTAMTLQEALDVLEAVKRDSPYTHHAGIDDVGTTLAALVQRCQALGQDAARLDWLADRENTVGNVQLPTACVEANLHSLRAAIDAAMLLSGGPG